MATITHASRLEAGRWIFTRIVVGVDGSQQALEAARQSALLEDIDGQLTLVAAWNFAPTIVGGTGSEVPYYYDEDLQRSHAENASYRPRLRRPLLRYHDDARAGRTHRRSARGDRPQRGHAGRRRLR